MATQYDMPTIVLRNARYRGHRESEKRLSSHNEQVYSIHTLFGKLQSQEDEIKKNTNEWFHGAAEKASNLVTKVIKKTFPASGEQTMYHVIEHEELRKVNSVVVKLNGVTLTNYKVLHGSIYVDLESLVGAVSSTAILSVDMNVTIVNRPFVNIGLTQSLAKVKRIDERISEAERKYREYEDAHE